MTDVRASMTTPPGDTGGAAPGAAGPARVDPSLLGSLVVVVVAGGGLAAAGRYSALALLVAVAVVQGAFSCAWVLGTGMLGRKGALLVAALAAGGADAAVSIWPHGRLGTLVAVLGLSVPVMFMHQLARGAARTKLVSSLSSVALLVVTVVALPAVIQLRHEFVDAKLGGIVVEAVVAALAAALVVGYLVDLIAPVPRFDADVPRGMLALLPAAAVGGALGHLVLRGHADFVGGRSVFLGAAVGALAALLGVAAAFVLHSSPAPIVRVWAVFRPVCAALLPICLLAPGAFLLCLAIRS